MSIYRRKSNWKIYLSVAGLLIFLISLVYTNYLAQKLIKGEETKAKLLVQAYQDIQDTTDLDRDLTFQGQILEENRDVPIIAVNMRGEIEYARNFGDMDQDTNYLRKVINSIKSSGPAPFYINEDYLIYYRQSQVLTLLTYFPLLQILLLSVFILLGYFGFSTARRAEQNRVWVGMAKETAHQLGTPISAIIAWIEHLKASSEEDPEKMEIIEELTRDVSRLELIADRFSKIGAAPDLKKVNIYDELNEVRDYMIKRSPRNVHFDFPPVGDSPKWVNINSHLFEWVLENLIRNALDAMEGKGVIQAKVYEEKGFIFVDISDTGKGIPSRKFKTVFQPGYSTKKRGWGLGLSLAKRIINEYHKGKIYVKRSTPNEGTTFTIGLPAASVDPV